MNTLDLESYSSEDRFPKVVLSPQPSPNILLDMDHLARGTNTSSTHQWAGIGPFHKEACLSPQTNLTYKEADTRNKSGHNPATHRKERDQKHRKLEKIMTENMFQMK